MSTAFSERVDPTSAFGGVRSVLLDFDGPICDLYAGLPAAAVADRLRGVVAKQGVLLPERVAATTDPFEVLGFAAGICPHLTSMVEAELRECELAAVATAVPTPGACEVLDVCRAAGRSVAVVSGHAADAVSRYLAQHELAVAEVVARTVPDPNLIKPLVRRAVHALGADPAESVMVGDSVADIEAARAAGVPAVGYARRPADAPRLLAAGAATVIGSMADLARSLVAV